MHWLCEQLIFLHVKVYDISPVAVAEMRKAGATPADSPKETAKCQAVAITMLPNGNIVEAVLIGDAGTIIAEMSSVTPAQSKYFTELAAEKNCPLLDSPVSGGKSGAINGTLAFMIGGSESVVEQMRDVFDAMGKFVTLTGPNGSGSVTKLANQIMGNLNIAAVSATEFWTKKLP